MQNSAQDFQVGTIRPVECFKEGFEIIKSDYWLLFAISILGAIIGGVSLYIAFGAMICGIYLCYLKKIDGQQIALDDLWKGMAFFKPGLVVTIFIVVPLILVYVGLYAPVMAAAIFAEKMSPNEIIALLGGSVVFDLVLTVLMVCFHTLILFSYLLIIDRGLSGFQAMKTSARAVWKNLKGVAGIFGVGFVLTLCGMLACGVGVYFVIPILLAGYTVAYRKIFPAMENRFNNPPAPYENL